MADRLCAYLHGNDGLAVGAEGLLDLSPLYESHEQASEAARAVAKLSGESRVVYKLTAVSFHRPR